MAATWRQQQAERLKDLIYNTALELFRERGYESTSVDRITARAGVAKGTFFNHFPSKDHVLALWYEEITLAILRNCRAAKFRNAEAAVLALASGLAEAGMRDAGLYASKSRNWSETVSGEEEKLDAELLRYLREQLEGGRGRGELSGLLDVDFFAGLILAVLTGTAKNWVVAGGNFDLKQAFEARLKFLFAAGKGCGNNADRNVCATGRCKKDGGSK